MVGGRHPPPANRVTTTSSSSSWPWPSSSSSVSPPSVEGLALPSSHLLALLLLGRLLLRHRHHLLPRSFSSPSLRAEGGRLARDRGARSSRGRRRAVADTRP